MPLRILVEEELTRSVIGAFYEVYKTLGYGFLEHIYKAALERELRSRGRQVGREVGIRVRYKGEELAWQRIDMIVDKKLIVEIKSTVDLHAGAKRQVYNYLRATHLRVGLLLHFGLEPRFYRIVELHTGQTTPTRSETDSTDKTDLTDRSSAVRGPIAASPEEENVRK
jgi:GxxExxY protein